MDAWLYIVLLGLVIAVYAWLMPKSEKTLPSTMLKEFEETIEHFSMDMEEENRQLLQVIAEMKKDYEQQTKMLYNRMEWLEKQNQDLSDKIGDMSKSSTIVHTGEVVSKDIIFPVPSTAEPLAEVPLTQSIPKTDPEATIRVRYDKLFALYDQGKSTDFIAKKLGMNKGEVMLIMQLAKQEEQLRV